MMDIRKKMVELLGKAIGDAVASTSEGKDVLSLDNFENRHILCAEIESPKGE